MPGGFGRIKVYHLRITSQLLFFIVAVLGVFGVAMSGMIYPFFFCPASPGACAGCPIWVIEHGTLEIVSGAQEGALMLLYLIGLFVVIGAVVGRSFCGWACPVGTLQDIYTWLGGRTRKNKPLLTLTGVSLLLILIGSVGPYIAAENELDITSYMWMGYVGSIGVFLAALAGISFLRTMDNMLPPFMMIGIGVGLWLLHLFGRVFELDGTPLASLELMGLLALISFTIGLIGVVRLYIKDRLSGKKLSPRADWALRLVKVGLLLSIAPTTWFFDTLAFTDLDPIGGITATIPELLLDPGGWSGNQFFWYKMVFVVSVIGLVAFVDRAWCRYLCPIGAMYGPTNKVSITDIEFKADRCIHCQKCIEACPMAINPKEDKRDPECIRCGRCVEVCPTNAQVFVPVNRSIRGFFKK